MSIAAPVPPSEESIRDALRRVIDPEVGINIVDLGLIYRIAVTPQQVAIEMTMTSPACPLGDLIIDDVHAQLDRVLPAGCEAEVRLVWEPPWNPALMSPGSKARFGWKPDVEEL